LQHTKIDVVIGLEMAFPNFSIIYKNKSGILKEFWTKFRRIKRRYVILLSLYLSFVFSLLLSLSSVIKYSYDNHIKNDWRNNKQTQHFVG